MFVGRAISKLAMKLTTLAGGTNARSDFHQNDSYIFVLILRMNMYHQLIPMWFILISTKIGVKQSSFAAAGNQTKGCVTCVSRRNHPRKLIGI